MLDEQWRAWGLSKKAKGNVLTLILLTHSFLNMLV